MYRGEGTAVLICSRKLLVLRLPPRPESSDPRPACRHPRPVPLAASEYALRILEFLEDFSATIFQLCRSLKERQLSL